MNAHTPSLYWTVTFEDRPVTDIAVTVTEAGTKLSVSGDDPKTGAVADIVRGLTASASPSAGTIEELSDRLRTALETAGFGLQPGDGQTNTFEMNHDLRTGRMVGRAGGGQEDPVERDIARNIQRAITEAFRSIGAPLKAALDQALAADDHVAAAQAVQTAHKEGGLAFGADEALFDSLLRIEVGGLAEPLATGVRKVRLGLAQMLKREPAVEADIRALIAATADDDPWHWDYQTFLGVVLLRKGLTESAVNLWRRVANTATGAVTRAWAWRNLGMALPTPSPEALQAARASADAFLEAGDPREAVTSLIRVYELLEFEGPAVALPELQSLAALMRADGPLGDMERAELHHRHSERLLNLRAYGDALNAASEAIRLRRGLIGDEDALISALNLGALAADGTGDSAQAATWREEADALARETGSAHFAFADRVSTLMQAFDPEVAAAVLAEARGLGDADSQVGVELVILLHETSQDEAARLEGVEALDHSLRELHASRRMTTLVGLAMVNSLRDLGQPDRALRKLRAILGNDPLSLAARDQAIALMFATGAWGDAVIFLVEQCKLHDDPPDLLAKLGEASLEAGDAARAAPALLKALKADWPQDQRTRLEAFRDTALVRLTEPLPPVPPAEPTHPVLRQELEAALAAYSGFISADKRSTFFEEMSSKTPRWVSGPEQHAQNLLHTFLKARFLKRLDAVEEISTGAGRLDLMLKFSGGLSVIVELKMCGLTYSSTYAASGEDQLEHYMTNRGCGLGYLVVHDARIDSNGAALLSGDVARPGQTIQEVLIDISPRVSRRRKT